MLFIPMNLYEHLLGFLSSLAGGSQQGSTSQEGEILYLSPQAPALQGQNWLIFEVPCNPSCSGFYHHPAWKINPNMSSSGPRRKKWGKQAEKSALGLVGGRVCLFGVLSRGFASHRCHGSCRADCTLRPSEPWELSAGGGLSAAGPKKGVQSSACGEHKAPRVRDFRVKRRY